MADYSWFISHYPRAESPGASYLACADFAPSFGPPISLNDYAKFVVHYAGAGHSCAF
jgi:hypothetical protein